MKKIILAAAVLAMLSTTAMAATDCDAHKPYYMQKDSDGSILADILFLPFTAAITVMAVPVSAARDAAGDADAWAVTNNAACMPKAQAKHIVKHSKSIAQKVKKNFN